MGFGQIKSFIGPFAESGKLKYTNYDENYIDEFEFLFIYIDTISLAHKYIRNSLVEGNAKSAVDYSFEKFVHLFKNILERPLKKYLILTVDGKQPKLKKYTQTRRLNESKIQMNYNYKLNCIRSLNDKILRYVLKEERFNVQEVFISDEKLLGEGEHKCLLYRNVNEEKYSQYKNLHIIFSDDSDSIVDRLFVTDHNLVSRSDTMVMLFEKYQPPKFIYRTNLEPEEIIVCYWIFSMYGNDYIPTILQSQYLLSKLEKYISLILSVMPKSVKQDLSVACKIVFDKKHKNLSTNEMACQRNAFMFLFYCIYVLIPNRMFFIFGDDKEYAVYKHESELYESFVYNKKEARKQITTNRSLYNCICYHVYTTLWYLGYITNLFPNEGHPIYQRTKFENVYKPLSSKPFEFDDTIIRDENLTKALKQHLLTNDSTCSEKDKHLHKVLLFNLLNYILREKMSTTEKENAITM